MTPRLVDHVEVAEWEALLASDPRASVFHHPRWNQRYARFHPTVRARWFEVRDGAGALVGGLPFVESRRAGFVAWTSGVGGTFGGPVVTQPEGEAESALVDAFTTAGGWRVVRRELVWDGALPPAGPSPFRSIEAAVLDLREGFEPFLREHFPKKRRNECNRSDRRGLVINPEGSVAELAEFHGLYCDQAAEWGVRPEPLDYLKAVLEEEGSAHFFVGIQEGRVVGGHLCFTRPDRLFAWIGTTKRMPTTFPSSLLIREEARWAADHGLAWLDLGSSVGLTGVAQYKRLLGADSRTRQLLFREAWPLRAWGRWRGGHA